MKRDEGDVSRETSCQLGVFVQAVRVEAARQNLVARSTLATLDVRHVKDSLQLLAHCPSQAGSLVDVGSGAGFPGLVLAIASDLRVTLIEPRLLRANFLTEVVETLGLSSRVVVSQSRAERVKGDFDIITARAVAPLDQLLAMTSHLAHDMTVWVLPKGGSAETELAHARKSWQGSFDLRPSLTDAAAGIVVARGVRRKEVR